MIIQLLTILTCSELWRRGGDGQSLYRNPLIGVILAVVKSFLLGWAWIPFLYILAFWGLIQAFSYGLNTPIHRFWAWVFKKGDDGNYAPVEIATRATCGLLWSLGGIVFAIATGNWLAQIIYTRIMTVGVGLIGGLVKNVEISERAVGGIVAIAIFI